MAHYGQGTVVAYVPGRSSERVLANVIVGPQPDGSYDLDCKQGVFADCIFPVTGGESVEYFSSSMKNWIPARVLRPGKSPGTLDLDCKEAVDLSRVRLPSEAGMPANSYSQFSAASAAPMPPSASAVSPPSPTQGDFPLGLQPGEHCFYKSSSHGWISARVLEFRSEDQTYDLDVKQRVRPESIYSLKPGAAVDYHSVSADKWIPAQVLQKGHEQGTFDLDCKIGVVLSRLRPRQDLSGGGGSVPVVAMLPTSNTGAMGSPYPVVPPAGLTPNSYTGSSPGSHSSGQWSPNLQQGQGEEPHHLQQTLRPVVQPSTAAKLDQLRQAVQSQDPSQIRNRLESQSVLKLVGDELDQAGHALWALEARPAALEELKNAAAGSSVVALEAAIEAAMVVGVSGAELEAASLSLQSLQTTLWRYQPEDDKHIDIRGEPSVDGRRMAHRLLPGEVFRVSDETRGADGLLYLKLEDGRGWVFEAKPGPGTLCVRHRDESPGVYIISHDKAAVTPTAAIGSDDEVIARLSFGTIVNVLEVKETEEGRVRGRIDHPGGWISILNIDNGKRWAQKKATKH